MKRDLWDLTKLLSSIIYISIFLQISLFSQSSKPIQTDDKPSYAQLGVTELEALAQKGWIEAMYELGERYRKGIGVQKNEESALKWYRLAAEAGDPHAQFQVGLHYGGKGLPKNSKEAIDWYQKAAEVGLAEAQYNLAVMYDEQEGRHNHPFVNIPEAIKWYEKAAAQGDADAAYNLGLIYRKGKGSVAKDISKALMWYQKAVELGSADAANNIGSLYYNGKEIEENDKEALKWFLLAAQKGYTTAFLNLGKMYAQGEKNTLLKSIGLKSNSSHRVLQNRVEAYKYFHIALLMIEDGEIHPSEGDPDALEKEILEWLNKTKFTEEEKREGKKRAQDWLSKHDI